MPADVVAIARDLLRCPSVTPAEGGALACVAEILSRAGFAVERPVFSEPGYPDVENLYARIGTAGPHLVFAGHTDVVPPGDESKWTHPPFGGEVADGVLYGRGAVDMKGAVACALAAALDHIEANGGTPKGSLSFLLTGDEEGVAVNGTVKLLRWAADRGQTFDHCLLGEPTNPGALGEMIKIGRRGSQNGTLVVTGTPGHVAYPHLADNPVRHVVRMVAALLAEPLDAGTDHFDPSNLEFTSIDVGNKTVNVIPAEARARFNIRFNDRHTQQTLRALVDARAAAAAQGARWRIDWEPSNADAFLTAPGPFVGLVSDAVASVTGRAPTLSTSGGTSDARFIKNYGPVIEFGLVNASMHGLDERVPVADLVALTAIYREIFSRYFG
ncbi:succinyl-diaminopimelate desuccinylase [Rhodoplanes sp. TEM]|uniref:Succinyl-diaminopimelate desuccinylase n=1 Tax=Rhodoplanes tepidamans TaxID=200616 RepID=A0ABT5JE17_RHOTP|nr:MULTISPECIES: succinyl-diaminopimelate desuccinylase [Rhodoplanes]MDC7787862.1 succinyl-diaminopimelate desuccinylase [Rhodoplanes tepidamans]MDC7985679.1 succinyl-diaminopimelate desuccinylase [Rhodoplanes sp. TEM]MDQ0357875.1 succinyl-diaminopimelate desuccinylase [Rhodoplanes tepidamans]